MADVINALMRRKNKKGVAKEERIKGDEEGRKKEKTKVFFFQSEKDTRPGLNPGPRLYTV